MQGRRRGGVGAALTREQIIDVAEDMARREGLESVTVRRVSAEIGVTAAALYWHLEDKQDLVRALVDRASARIERPGPEYGTWYERLVRFYLSTREEFSAYAGLSGALMTAEPTDATLQNCLFVLEVLQHAGFDEPTALSLFDTLSTFSWGHLMMIDMSRINVQRAGSEGSAAYTQRVRALINDRPEYAVFVRSLRHFNDRRNETQLVRGIELIVTSAAAASGISVPSSSRFAYAT